MKWYTSILGTFLDVGDILVSLHWEELKAPYKTKRWTWVMGVPDRKTFRGPWFSVEKDAKADAELVAKVIAPFMSR